MDCVCFRNCTVHHSY